VTPHLPAFTRDVIGLAEELPSGCMYDGGVESTGSPIWVKLVEGGRFEYSQLVFIVFTLQEHQIDRLWWFLGSDRSLGQLAIFLLAPIFSLLLPIAMMMDFEGHAKCSFGCGRCFEVGCTVVAEVLSQVVLRRGSSRAEMGV
jgi:hypothetical protein